MNEIVLCSDFFDSFCKLSPTIQKKIRSFLDKFIENNLANGLNYEKINEVDGKQLYSARIDEAYRAIIYEDKKFYVLWVDKHDESYAWARNKKKLKLNSEIVYVSNKSEHLNDDEPVKNNSNIFSKISVKELQNLGVQENQIDIVKDIKNAKTLEQYKEIFESDVYANLEWLANKFVVKDVQKFNDRQRQKMLDFIKNEVLTPALNCNELDADIKASVQDTYERLKKKKTKKEIVDFFEDALMARRGKTIHEEFHKLGLKGFEEIVEDVRKLATE